MVIEQPPAPGDDRVHRVATAWPPPSPAYPRPPGEAQQPGQQARPAAPPWHAAPTGQPAQAPAAHHGPPAAPTARAGNASVVRAYLLDRVRRFDPRRVHWTVLGVGVLLLVTWVLLADVLLTPGLVAPIDAATPTMGDPAHVITWLSFMTGYGLTSWGVVMLLMTYGLVARVGAVSVPVLSTLGMLAVVATAGGVWERTWGWSVAFVGLGLVAIGLVIAAAIVVRGRMPLAAGAGMLVAAQWGVAMLVASSDPSSNVFVSEWSVFGFLMLIVLSALTVGGVAEWAQRAHASTDGFARRLRIGRWVAPAVAIAVAVFSVLRLTVLSDLFGANDSTIWVLGRSWTTWIHAALVTAVIVALVWWSDRAPMRARGQLLTTAILSAAAAGPQLVFAFVYVLLIVTPAAMHDSLLDWSGAVVADAIVIALWCLPLLLILLLPTFWRSTGQAGAIVALVTIVPFLVLLQIDVRGWAVLSPQVLPVLAGATAIVGILGLVLRRDLIDRVVLLRLAVVPCIAVHAGQLLPAALADALARPVVVVASLVAMLLFGPRRTQDAMGRSRAFLAPFAGQAFIVSVTIVGITIGGDIDALTTMAVVYLALPVATVLCCRVERRVGADPSFVPPGALIPTFALGPR